MLYLVLPGVGKCNVIVCHFSPICCVAKPFHGRALAPLPDAFKHQTLRACVCLCNAAQAAEAVLLRLKMSQACIALAFSLCCRWPLCQATGKLHDYVGCAQGQHDVHG